MSAHEFRLAAEAEARRRAHAMDHVHAIDTVDATKALLAAGEVVGAARFLSREERDCLDATGLDLVERQVWNDGVCWTLVLTRAEQDRRDAEVSS